MSPTTSLPDPPPPFAALTWTRLAVRGMHAMLANADAPVRGAVVGTAGSGKTSLLAHLRLALADRGIETLTVVPGRVLGQVPSGSAILVDDAHLLDDAALGWLAERAADPDASVVVARRPWPAPDRLHDVARTIERSHAPIVLGHVTAADLQGTPDGLPAPSECVRSILALTGGVAWLVVEALAIHGDTPCAGDTEHRQIVESLRSVIAYRLLSLEPRVSDAIRDMSLRAPGAVTWTPELQELVLAAHAEGLLLQNGEAVPLVRSAVRAITPLDRLLEAGVLDADADLAATELSHVRDPRVAHALLHEADAIAGTDLHRALDLYRRAGECGADPATIAVRRADASWTLGEIDRAARELDTTTVPPQHPDRERAIDLSAAIWVARGSMETADAVYAAAGPSASSAQGSRAAIAAIAAGDAERSIAEPAAAMTEVALPFTLDVSLGLLVRGLRSTLGTPTRSLLQDLVRASEMYTASRCREPIPELPAVIAALTAINLGELEVACSILRDAERGGQGGPAMQDRLLLWQGWVALQRERPREARAALVAASSSERRIGPRDRLLADAIEVALSRRYSDKTAMMAAWRRARDGMLHAQFDLFTLLPLAELVTAAARAGDGDRVRSHFEGAIARLDALGAPPLWSAHLHWAGIQQGILANDPAALKPHARALVAAAAQSRLASLMAQAGRVWTSVLAGSVDAERVEQAAMGLADVGLAWDGARLAGHGAGRTPDRRDSARLLACARQLHPRDEASTDGDESTTSTAPAGRDPMLSAREREVAMLVLQGKTYSEIGASIFISPRTAEHHIARIRRRLGATSRSDLIAKLRLAFEDATAPDELRPSGREIA